MCGILGILRRSGGSVSLSDGAIAAMRDAMTHRGPDGAGLFRRGSLVLAHRRLAIRDLDSGQQPWLADDGQLALVYNGELYNDADLRAKLSRHGHRFSTRCDTETVMAAYRQWGIGFLVHLRGMFALGLYDFRSQTLLLARDRCGIKPLYLSEVGGDLIFASDPAAILAHPEYTAAPDYRAISHYLTTLRRTLGRRTLFEGIRQLLPAERLVIDSEGTRIERYWDYPLPSAVDGDGFEAARAELAERLPKVVQAQMVSDVPVGLMYSGGVDSTSLASAMTASGGSIRSCCGGTPESDDLAFARQGAEFLNLTHAEERFDASRYFRDWQALLEQQAVPVSTPNEVIIAGVAARLRQSVGVVLGGEGADEAFCGYSIPHWSARDYSLARRHRQPGSIPPPHTLRQFRASLFEQYGRDEFASEADHYFALHSLMPGEARRALWQPWVAEHVDHDAEMYAYYQQAFDEHAGVRDEMDTMSVVLHRINLAALLERLDTATMRHGLEARVPFTDERIVEFAFSLPSEYKIRIDEREVSAVLASSRLESRGSLQSKRLLRSASRSWMPESFAERPKSSFPVPVARWCRDDWRKWCSRKLLSSPFVESVFERQMIRQIVEQADSTGLWLWPLVNIACWGDRQFA